MAEKGYTVVRFADYDDEDGTVSVRSPILTDLNFAAQEVLKDDFITAMAGITLDKIVGSDHGNRELLALGPSDDVDSQRERKWLVHYHDVGTLERYTKEIPCADLAQLDPEDRGNANIGDAGVVDAFIAAFDAYVRSPTGGISAVDEITHVGRNV